MLLRRRQPQRLGRYTSKLKFMFALRLWVRVQLISWMFVPRAIQYWLSTANSAVKQTRQTDALRRTVNKVGSPKVFIYVAANSKILDLFPLVFNLSVWLGMSLCFVKSAETLTRMSFTSLPTSERRLNILQWICPSVRTFKPTPHRRVSRGHHTLVLSKFVPPIIQTGLKFK